MRQVHVACFPPGAERLVPVGQQEWHALREDSASVEFFHGFMVALEHTPKVQPRPPDHVSSAGLSLKMKVWPEKVFLTAGWSWFKAEPLQVGL